MILTSGKLNTVLVNRSIIKEQVRYLGMKYPLIKGWKDSLIGSDVSNDFCKVMQKLKDQYMKDRLFRKGNKKYKQKTNYSKNKYKKQAELKVNEVVKEENKQCFNAIRKGKSMFKIEQYAKENKCSITKAMIALM